MRRHPMLIGATLAASLAVAAWAEAPKLMGPHDFQALPSRPADARASYGEGPEQFGELRLPAGRGPHPVVVLIHGGCFKAAYATLRDMAPMADALKADGVATWNIEYRRLGSPGGGWPGSYQDVGRAIDHLRVLAPRHGLDLRNVVVVGHSAGGHFATWAATRRKLPADSDVATPDPLPLAGVVDLAGPFDMRENIDNYQAQCGDPVIHQMLGGAPDQQPERYRQASAGAQLPLKVPQVLIWDEHETYVPRPLAEAYVARAKAAGDDVRLLIVDGAGHFEIASPSPPAWPILHAEIRRLLKRR